MDSIYRHLSAFLSPIIRLNLYLRRWKGKEDQGNPFYERFGVYRHLNGQRKLRGAVWIHGASVGESLASLPLLNLLLSDNREKVLLTVGTKSAKHAIKDKLPKDPNCVCIYAPVDTPSAVNNFFEYWAPKAGIFLESEIWPNLILNAESRNVPLGIANGRMSSKSFYRWTPRCKLNAKQV